MEKLIWTESGTTFYSQDLQMLPVGPGRRMRGGGSKMVEKIEFSE